MKLIVGSKAAKHWGVNRKEPLDVDLWVDSREYTKTKGLDISVIPRDILSLVPSVELDDNSCVATLDALYTIKCSHLQWDIKWDKTKADILYFKSKGANLLVDLYYKLVDHWETIHGDKSFLCLNKNKEEFFEDNVTYKYDHDYLHQLVSYPLAPVYTKLVEKGQEVLLDEYLFSKLSFDEQVQLFQEEIHVIAFERWLAHQPDMSNNLVYELALKKTITNLTKNWASDFIISNLAYFKPNYKLLKPLLKLNKREYEMTQAAQDKIKELYEESGTEETIQYFIRQLAEEHGYDINDEFLANNNYKSLMQEGGGEGGSEYCEAVFRLAGHNFHCEYAYYSYQGHDFDYVLGSIKFVSPKEKTITVWE